MLYIYAVCKDVQNIYTISLLLTVVGELKIRTPNMSQTGIV